MRKATTCHSGFLRLARVEGDEHAVLQACLHNERRAEAAHAGTAIRAGTGSAVHAGTASVRSSSSVVPKWSSKRMVLSTMTSRVKVATSVSSPKLTPQSWLRGIRYR